MFVHENACWTHLQISNSVDYHVFSLCITKCDVQVIRKRTECCYLCVR
jgi:hypothetical protein